MRVRLWQGAQAGGYPFKGAPQAAFGLLAYTGTGVQHLTRNQLDEAGLKAWLHGLVAPLWMLADQQAQEGGAQTSPYMRELGGRLHSLVIGDQLPGIYDVRRFPLTQFRPLGHSEGERAACWLFKRLASIWQDALAPADDVLLALLADFAARLRPLGAADFVYSDGVNLVVHCHQLQLYWRQHEAAVEVCSDVAQPAGWQLLVPESLSLFSAGQLQQTHKDFELQLLDDD